MAKETLEVGGEVELYKNFGWVFVEERHSTSHYRSGKSSRTRHVTHYILERDTDMPNYVMLKAYQEKYFYLKKSKKYYSGIDLEICVLLFLFFIIPGIIYIAIKNSNKNNVETYNNGVDKQMEYILKEAKALL